MSAKNFPQLPGGALLPLVASDGVYILSFSWARSVLKNAKIEASAYCINSSTETVMHPIIRVHDRWHMDRAFVLSGLRYVLQVEPLENNGTENVNSLRNEDPHLGGVNHQRSGLGGSPVT